MPWCRQLITQLNTAPHRHLTEKNHFDNSPQNHLDISQTGSFYRTLRKKFDISQANHFDRSKKTLRYIATSSVPHPNEESLRYLAKTTFDSVKNNTDSQKTNFHSVLQKKFDISQDNHFDRSIKALRYIATSSVPHPTEESLRYLAQDYFHSYFRNYTHLSKHLSC